jgi:glycerate 2-kinase
VPTPAGHAADFLRECFEAGVAAVQPQAAFSAASLPAPSGRSPWIIAVGKAAEGMAIALTDRLTARGTPPAGGLVIGAAHGPTVPPVLAHLVGDHPMPGAASLAAGEALQRVIDAIPPDAEVHVAISGGASALMAAPREGVSVRAMIDAFGTLHAAGTPIAEMNRSRSAFTRWSDGALAAALAPRPVHCWLISDVPGDDLRVIGSGPCIAEPPFPHVSVTLLASNAHACAAAARAAARRDIVQRVDPTPLVGEAREVGRRLAIEVMQVARDWARQNEALLEDGHGDAVRPLLLVWGGETTVTRGDDAGLGGRAQELALAAAEMFEISPFPITMLAAGTDGRDGPTDAAGGIVDQTSWMRMRAAGDPAAALARHDSHTALDGIGALLRTGPTGTNVMDLVLAVVGWDPGVSEVA